MARPIRNMSKILIKVCIVPLWDCLSIIDIFTCTTTTVKTYMRDLKNKYCSIFHL